MGLSTAVCTDVNRVSARGEAPRPVRGGAGRGAGSRGEGHPGPRAFWRDHQPLICPPCHDRGLLVGHGCAIVEDRWASVSRKWRETWTGLERKRGVMATTTMRISLRAHDVLQELAETSGSSMQAVLEQAIERYRRQQLLEATNAAYAALRAAPAAWAHLEQDRQAWEQIRATDVETRRNGLKL